MPFDFKETIQGLAHLGIGLEKRLLKKPIDFYIKQFNTDSLSAKIANDANETKTCYVCGYALIDISLKDRVLLRTCSAMPIINSFDNEQFQDWLSSTYKVNMLP